MHKRLLFWLSIGLLCVGGFIYFRHSNAPGAASESRSSSSSFTSSAGQPAHSSPQPSALGTAKAQTAASQTATNAVATSTTNKVQGRLAYRLSNTAQSVRQLAHSEHALLLANALIDTTRQPLGLPVPASLQAAPDNGAYVVQANGPVDAAFRARLGQAGAVIVSYIPNNAYLVRVSAAGAQQLAGVPGTQAVLPYEPYYKLDSALLPLALENQPLAGGESALKLTLFADATGVPAALAALGVSILGQDRSPFGPVLTVSLPDPARLPGVQLISPARAKVTANDLARPRLGAAADSLVGTNYLGLSGTNILVTMADSGVDSTHPDLAGRVFPPGQSDPSGHGTHVAGSILGSGLESSTVTNAIGSLTNLIGSPSNNMWRGIAPMATLYSLGLNGADG